LTSGHLKSEVRGEAGVLYIERREKRGESVSPLYREEADSFSIKKKECLCSM
jgi:hypothetical protein